jgi:hypothetical protein
VRYHLDNPGIVYEDVDAPVVIQDGLNQSGNAAFVGKIGFRVAGVLEFANQTHTRLVGGSRMKRDGKPRVIEATSYGRANP